MDVSVQGAIHDFLNMGRSEVKSRIHVSITVLIVFLDRYQYIIMMNEEMRER